LFEFVKQQQPSISSNLFILFHPFSSFFILFLRKRQKKAGKGYQVSFHPFSSFFILFHPFSSFFILFHPFSSKKAEKGRKRQENLKPVVVAFTSKKALQKKLFETKNANLTKNVSHFLSSQTFFEVRGIPSTTTSQAFFVLNSIFEGTQGFPKENLQKLRFC